MRRAISPVMMALALMALFLGNCFSCPEVLLSARQAANPHSCCHPHQSSRIVCQTQGLQSFEKTEAGQAPAPLLAALTELPPAPATIEPSATESATALVRPEPAPPHPLSLSATLRV